MGRPARGAHPRHCAERDEALSARRQTQGQWRDRCCRLSSDAVAAESTVAVTQPYYPEDRQRVLGCRKGRNSRAKAETRCGPVAAATKVRGRTITFHGLAG